MIYLDFNATTPVDPEVLEAMIPLFSQNFGNASSAQHAFGMAALEKIEIARGQVADLVGARAASIIFTSGSTEAINLGIRGVLPTVFRGKKRILVASTEHKAVLESAYLGAEENGLVVEEIPVLQDGIINLEALAEMISDDVALVAVMHVNNETGVINPIKLVSELAHKYGALFFSDLTQSVGKIKVDIEELGVDLGACSSHKIYGPKGVGALFGDKRIIKNLSPLIVGGGHESGLRSGTQNVPGIVGFGAAAQLVKNCLSKYQFRMLGIKNHFFDEVRRQIPGVWDNGSYDRVNNTINLWFKGADANAVMTAMPNVCVSSGSACQSAVPAPSHVLIAMGIDRTAASESIRFSFGNTTTDEEVDQAISDLVRAVGYVRAINGVTLHLENEIEVNVRAQSA
jgi:cysteine desulfurase